MHENNHKAGFVSIIGLPNVGKSTLLNALLDTKLSIVSHKAQTTRHRILGFLNGDDYQIVFSDTPGFIRDAAYKMHQSMNKAIRDTFSDADLVLLLVEPGMKAESIADLIEAVRKSKIPFILVVNKAEKMGHEEAIACRSYWAETFGPEMSLIFVSAKEKIQIKELEKEIARLLPLSPPYYDKEDLSDRNQRFFVAEIIREKVFLLYDKEIPYSVQIEVEDFKEKENINVIQATLYVERPSQKPIILGKNGDMIKKLGTEARKDIEQFIEGRVFLELTVKVKENWRNDDLSLKRFGYTG